MNPVLVRPVPYGAFGHYRVNHRCAIVATQAANSRLFSLRYTGTNLLIPTLLQIFWLATGAHTAAIEDSLDVFKVTGFSVSDTVNTVTPTASVKRGGGMAAAPGNVEIRGVTIAGAAAGMTGGTLTKDGGSFAQLPQWLLLAQPTAGPVTPAFLDALKATKENHPFVFAPNEGFIIENRVLLGAAAASSVYINLEYVEAPTGAL